MLSFAYVCMLTVFQNSFPVAELGEKESEDFLDDRDRTVNTSVLLYLKQLKDDDDDDDDDDEGEYDDDEEEEEEEFNIKRLKLAFSL